MSAELILAAIAGADLCLTYGKKLVSAYQDFKNAGEIVKSKILIVEAIWHRTAMQVEFVKRVANAFEEEYCRIHVEVLEMLKSKLMMAISKIGSAVKSGGDGVKRWKLPLIRDAIEDTISQLEQWQRVFDPTWYLILRIGDRIIDSELSMREPGPTTIGLRTMSLKVESISSNWSGSTLAAAQSFRTRLKGGEATSNMHISLPENGLDWAMARPIEYSTTRIVQRTDSSKHYLVDSITYDASLDIAAARTDTESLAIKLQQIDSDVFGLLSCHGVIKRRHNELRQITSLNLAFRMPSEKATPSSLRHYLLQPATFSLTAVLNVAWQLAGAVSFIHTCDFVHKNIRPETILLFPEISETQGTQLGPAYLLGFDSFRSLHFRTLHAGDLTWERNLYRHPSRQGLRAQDKYIMQHDVYSLGVCLLELGLWKSFVEYEQSPNEPQDPKRILSSHLELKGEGFHSSTGDSFQPFTKVKEHLVHLAKSRLPLKMGDKYTGVVLTCLTCLDEGNEDFGDEKEMKDEDGILIGVRFIERVLLRLRELSF